MKTDNKITITLPDLSPSEAIALSNLLESLIHEVEFYYAEEIQNFANWYTFYRKREFAATMAVSSS